MQDIVRLLLEFCVQFWPLSYRKVIVKLDRVQKRFTRMLPGIEALSYKERPDRSVISDFPEKVNFYIMGNVSFFKSTWPEIRGNAVMFTGFLLGNLSQEELQSISLEHVCT
eukprot:g33144.t1